MTTNNNPAAGNHGAENTSGGRTPSLTTAALKLAAAGWRVLPCKWRPGPDEKATHRERAS
jgi:hypothetical protein